MKFNELFDCPEFFVGILLFPLKFIKLLIQMLIICRKFIILERIIKEVFGKNNFFDCFICIGFGVDVTVVLPILDPGKTNCTNVVEFKNRIMGQKGKFAAFE